jgi:hypothetical protein
MLSRFLLKKLVLPLSLASAASLILAQYCPWQGFFVNLGTTFIGVLFTFLYVDTILQRHERQQWAEAKARILRRIEQLANVIITQCRLSFNFGMDIFSEVSRDPGTYLDTMRAEMIRIAENVLTPAAAPKIDRMDQAEWKKFIERVQTIWQAADHNIELFGNKLDPQILALLLNVQDTAWSFIGSYMTWPDIYGVPDDKLPVSKKISTIQHKRTLNKIAAEEMRKLLSLAVKLLQEAQPGHAN